MCKKDAAPKAGNVSAAANIAGGGKHSEYKVAKVLSAEPMKKKKGSILVGLALGSDTTATAITTYQNVEEGQTVIIAPEGASVSGKEIKRQKAAMGGWGIAIRRS